MFIGRITYRLSNLSRMPLRIMVEAWVFRSSAFYKREYNGPGLGCLLCDYMATGNSKVWSACLLD